MQTSDRHNLKKLYFFILVFLISGITTAQNIDHWETIVMSDDLWRYIVPVTEPASDWNTAGFDESSWLQGKGGIGYGDNDDSTVLIPPVGSVYMRIRFNIPDLSVIAAAVLHADVDDGFVAYLNGHEIARDNIGTPGIRPAFSDFANNCIEPKLPYGQAPNSYPLNHDTLAKYLLLGDNILALQVHNCNLTSSDLSSSIFFSAGITNGNTYFRPVPSWFNIAVNAPASLPIISINTNGQAIPDGYKIMATMKVIDNGPGKQNYPDDPATGYNDSIGIELHGQSSLMFPKQPYSVELRVNSHVQNHASLIGLPDNSDFLLIANYSDKSLLRNSLTYFLGAKIGGGWQPRVKFCVVYLNGDYRGIYNLTEKIKRDSTRLNISGLNPLENSGTELTGGYILKVDKTWNLTQDVDFFTTYPAIMFPNSRYYNYTYVYPKADKITPQQKSYIKSFLTEFETVLNSYYFKDPEKGFRKYIDMGSFADYQIMEELINNVDGYRYSTFFYKDKITHGNKLHAGPLWDHDLCYGNEDYYEYCWVTNGWLYTHYGPDEGYCMHWWARLMEDPLYVRRFVTRWRELRMGSFRTDSVMHYIDSATMYMGAEINRNFQRWPILGTYVWPNRYVFNTYDEEVGYLKSWVTDRLNWMDSATGLTSDLYNESFSDNSVIVYPNPVKDNLTITLKLASESSVRLEMIDLSGIRIWENVTTLGSGNQEIIVDMSKFKTGYYILRIMQGDKSLGIKKIVKY